MKMKEQHRYAEEYFWYAGGMAPLTLACVFLASNGDLPVVPQRFLMASIGALLGGTLFLGIGELIRPTSASSQTAPGAVPGPQNIYGGNNVFSYGQSGGITAGTVNIGPIPRSLSQPRMDQLKKQISEQLPKDKPIIVVAVAGDSEALDFAYEILSYLKGNGFSVKSDEVSQIYFKGPVKGLAVSEDAEVRTLMVGANLL